MATKQDSYGDATLLATQEGTEIESGSLIAENIDAAVCLDFNGTTQYIGCGSAAGLDNIWGSGGTIAFWMKWDTANSSGSCIVDKLNSTAATGWSIRVKDTGAIRFFHYTNSTNMDLVSTAVTTAGRWFHVVVTLNSTTFAKAIYINGVLDTATAAPTGTRGSDAASNLEIGTSNAAVARSLYFDGMLDDIRLWAGTILTAAEVRQVYATGVNPSTATGWWKLNDNSGTTAVDSGSGGNNGTLVNTPTWTTTHQPFYANKSRATSTELLTGLGSTAVNSFLSTISKKPGGSRGKLQFSSDNAAWKNANGDLVSNTGGYSFDGTNDVITFVAGDISADLNGSAVVCFGGWVYSNAFPTASIQTILRVHIEGAGNLAGLYIAYSSSTINYGGRSRAADSFQSASYSYTGDKRWDHVFVVMDIANDTLKLYLNGVLVQTTTGLAFGNASYTDANNQGVVDRIGAGDSGGAAIYFWNGNVDDFRIYSSSLTAAEIWDLYSRHKSPPATPVGWWKLDGDATDSSGNGNNGTLTNSPTAISNFNDLPQFGEPISDDNDVPSLDGVDDKAVYTAGNYRSGDSLGSVCGWFMPNALNSVLFCSADTTGIAYYLYFGISSGGGFSFGQTNNDTADVATTTAGQIVVGRWHHFAFVSTGAAYIAYLNGVAQTQTYTGGSNTGDWFADTTARDNFVIGCLKRLSETSFFNGQLANFSLYNDVRTATEVLADFQAGYIDESDANLINYWRMNESSGDFTDSRGGITLTVTGTTRITDIYRPQATTPAQQTLSLSSLSLTSATYYRALYDSVAHDRAMAMTEVTVDYTAGGLAQRITKLMQAVQTSNNW